MLFTPSNRLTADASASKRCRKQGGGCFDFIGCPPVCCRGWNTTSQQNSATTETPPQCPSPHLLLKATNCSFFSTQLECSGIPGMPAHHPCTQQWAPDSSRGWRGLAESDGGTKPCSTHWDSSGSTSPSHFPCLQGEIIFLLWEHVHYRHGFQKGNENSKDKVDSLSTFHFPW